jgi:hypothetical protein
MRSADRCLTATLEKQERIEKHGTLHMVAVVAMSERQLRSGESPGVASTPDVRDEDFCDSGPVNP